MGTVTVRLAVVAAVTVPLAAPNHTTLLAGVALKLVPVIVIEAVGAALFGENDVIVGTCAIKQRLLNKSSKIATSKVLDWLGKWWCMVIDFSRISLVFETVFRLF